MVIYFVAVLPCTSRVSPEKPRRLGIPKDPDGFLTVEQMFFQVRGVEKCDMPCYDVQHHPTRSNVQQSQKFTDSKTTNHAYQQKSLNTGLQSTET